MKLARASGQPRSRSGGRNRCIECAGAATTGHGFPGLAGWAVGGFRLTFDRFGVPGAPAVVSLHDWPGTRDEDHRRLDRLLTAADAELDIVVPACPGSAVSTRRVVSVSQSTARLHKRPAWPG